MSLWKLREDEQNRLDNFIENVSELDDPISKEAVLLLEIVENAHEEALIKIMEQQDEINRLKDYVEDWTVKPNLGKHFDERF